MLHPSMIRVYPSNFICFPKVCSTPLSLGRYSPGPPINGFKYIQPLLQGGYLTARPDIQADSAGECRYHVLSIYGRMGSALNIPY